MADITEELESLEGVLSKFSAEGVDALILIAVKRSDNGRLLCNYAFPETLARATILQILQQTARMILRCGTEAPE